jgi:hypothetical protein
VVERGKPRFVQDAAIQVFTAGQRLRAILSAEQQAADAVAEQISQGDRRRRLQSWHELNEYHSVPYFQYTRTLQQGTSRMIQCDMDKSTSVAHGKLIERTSEQQQRDVQRGEGNTPAKYQHFLHVSNNGQDTVEIRVPWIANDRVQMSVGSQTG